MVNEQILREYIRYALLEENKTATLSSQNLSDIGQALHWLKLNKVIKNAGQKSEKKQDGRHHVSLNFKGSKKDLIDMVKARFGSFVDIN